MNLHPYEMDWNTEHKKETFKSSIAMHNSEQQMLHLKWDDPESPTSNAHIPSVSPVRSGALRSPGKCDKHGTIVIKTRWWHWYWLHARQRISGLPRQPLRFLAAQQ
jgi:hypothetical protein